MSVSALLVRPLACAFEHIERVLADRLQHPEAVVALAEEALLDQRLNRVEVGLRDLLSRFERAAAGEDGQPCEEFAFFRS